MYSLMILYLARYSENDLSSFVKLVRACTVIAKLRSHGTFKRSYNSNLVPEMPEMPEVPDLPVNRYDDNLLQQQENILQDMHTVDNPQQYQNDDPYRLVSF